MDEAAFCRDYARKECLPVANACMAPAADCEAARVAACDARVRDARAAGRAFRVGNVDACLDTVSRTYAKSLITAEDLRELDRACARVFGGNLAANERCARDSDCGNGLICDKGRCGQLRIVDRGANCGNPGEICRIGEVCRPLGACTPGDCLYTCNPKRSRGMACNDSDDPCDESQRCVSGTCIDRLPLQAACQASGDCLSGYCSPEFKVCGAGLNFAWGAPQCWAFGVKRPDGATGPAPAPPPDAGAASGAP
jgi:hypothetical protein